MELRENNESQKAKDEFEGDGDKDFLKRSVDNPGKEYKGNPGKEYDRPDLDKYHQ
jgi:hypothetical protein